MKKIRLNAQRLLGFRLSASGKDVMRAGVKVDVLRLGVKNGPVIGIKVT